jgi:hypothetical protein
MNRTACKAGGKGGGQPAEMIGVCHVLRQRAGRHLREVRRDGGAAGEAAVGGVGVELRHAAGVRVDGFPAPPRHGDFAAMVRRCGHRTIPRTRRGGMTRSW